MKKTDSKTKLAGLSHDPIEFLAMTEISIIAHLADNLFAKTLPEGLTVAQFGVLNHLLRLDTQESVGELANAMQVSQPTMSSTIRKLKDKGYVTLKSTASDKRVKRVHVVEAGRTIRNEAVSNIGPIQQKLMAQLPQAQWKEILPILTNIRAILDSERS